MSVYRGIGSAISGGFLGSGVAGLKIQSFSHSIFSINPLSWGQCRAPLEVTSTSLSLWISEHKKACDPRSQGKASLRRNVIDISYWSRGS